VREPVDGVGAEEALAPTAARRHPGKLSVAGADAELVGIQVDPPSVRGELRAINVPGARVRVPSVTACRGHQRQPARRREVTARQVDKGECAAIRAHPMQEVVSAGVVADPAGRAAADRCHVQVTVVGGQVDQATGRVEHVVVVDRREVGDRNLHQLGSGLHGKPPQKPVTV
jgi:hypothetical protein